MSPSNRFPLPLKCFLRNICLSGVWLCTLSGCASFFVRDFNGPDGTPWHSTTCDTVARCYARAGAVCLKGYEVKNVDESARVSSVGYSNTPNGAGATLSHSTELTMMFLCK